MNDAAKEIQVAKSVPQHLLPDFGNSGPNRPGIHNGLGATDLGVLGDLPFGVRPSPQRRPNGRRQPDRSTHYVHDGSAAAGGKQEAEPGRFRQRYQRFAVAHAHMISHSLTCAAFTALTYLGIAISHL
jgi:hypothetical protein